MTLQASIEWIMGQARTVNTTAQITDNPSDLANSTSMWIVAYPAAGEFVSRSAGFGYDLDTVRIDIFTARGSDLNETMQRLEGYPHNIAHKIQADPTMGGNCETYGAITYQYAASEWSGVQIVGYVLTVTGIKTLATL